MRPYRLSVIAGVVALVAACHDTTAPGPVTATLSGTYVADSIYCFTTFDTGSEILTQGASLGLVLHSDSTITGHLTIPAAWMPDGLPSEVDTLTGSWTVVPGGFRVYGPWGTLMTRVDFAMTGDTAHAQLTVKGWPLDPFGYRLRMHRQ